MQDALQLNLRESGNPYNSVSSMCQLQAEETKNGTEQRDQTNESQNMPVCYKCRTRSIIQHNGTHPTLPSPYACHTVVQKQMLFNFSRHCCCGKKDGLQLFLDAATRHGEEASSNTSSNTCRWRRGRRASRASRGRRACRSPCTQGCVRWRWGWRGRPCRGDRP